MQKLLRELADSSSTCFKDKLSSENPVQEAADAIDISLCGNWILEPGEECDCGPDIFQCDDPCCYPADIPLDEKLYYNKSAISCYINQSHYCLSSSPLIYGVYVPMAVIIILTIIMFFVLKQDWMNEKKYFKHVTENNICVVTANRR